MVSSPLLVPVYPPLDQFLLFIIIFGPAFPSSSSPHSSSSSPLSHFFSPSVSCQSTECIHSISSHPSPCDQSPIREGRGSAVHLHPPSSYPITVLRSLRLPIFPSIFHSYHRSAPIIPPPSSSNRAISTPSSIVHPFTLPRPISSHSVQPNRRRTPSNPTSTTLHFFHSFIHTFVRSSQIRGINWRN